MKDFLADKDIRNANVKHSWVTRIMDLPTDEMRHNALEILCSWVTDEMEHLFGSFKEAGCVVMATGIYMLEYEAIKANDPQSCGGDYPILESADAAVFFYIMATGGPHDEEDREKARIFLQLMRDGYMKPDVDKLLRMAEAYNPGDRVNVSLRN